MAPPLPRSAVEARSWADLLRAARVLIDTQHNVSARRRVVILAIDPETDASTSARADEGGPADTGLVPSDVAARMATDLHAIGLEVLVGCSNDGDLTFSRRADQDQSVVDSAEAAPALPPDPIEWATAIVCIVGAANPTADHTRPMLDGALSKAVVRAVRRGSDSGLLLLPVRCCAETAAAVPTELRHKFFWDFHSPDAYNHNMIRRGCVPGILTLIAGLTTDSRFEQHAVKYTLRTLPSRLPSRNDDFVPRAAVVDLRALLDKSPVVLVAAPAEAAEGGGESGGEGAAICERSLGAVGKTAAAIEYAYAAKDKKSYSLIRWFDCDRGHVEVQFRAFAAELDLECSAQVDRQTLVHAVHAELAKLAISYLFVFDGVESCEQVKPFLPPPASEPPAGKRPALRHVLMTAPYHVGDMARREPPSAVWYAELGVPPLDEEEFDDLILADLPMMPADEVAKLRSYVASVAAGASMAAAILWHDNEEPEELFQALDAEVLAHCGTKRPPGGVEGPAECEGMEGAAVVHIALWRRCLKGASLLTPNGSAAFVYAVLSYLEQGAAPLWLVTELLSIDDVQDAFLPPEVNRDGYSLADAIAALRTYRVCRVSAEPDDTEWIRLHKFGQLFLLDEDSRHKDKMLVRTRVRALLSALTRLVQRLVTRVSHKRSQGCGNPRVCLSVAVEALEGVLRSMEPDSSDVSSAMYAAAFAYFHLGMPDIAADLLKSARAPNVEFCSIEDTLLYSRIFLGGNDPDGAVRLLRPVVARQRRNDDTQRATRAIAECMVALGEALESNNSTGEALAHTRDGSRILQKVPLTVMDDALLGALRQAALLAQRTGSLEAEYACLAALWQLQRGGSHPDVRPVLVTLRRLGLTAGALGRYVEAAGCISKAIELGSAIHSADDIDSLLGHLADAYGMTERHSEKQQLLKRLLESQVQRLGKEHIEVGRTLARLGVVVGDLGDLDQRVKLLERAVQLQQKSTDGDRANLAVALTNLATAYGSVHRLSDARHALEQALKLKISVFGPNSLDTAVTMANLGRIYLQSGEPARALDVLLPAYATRHRITRSSQVGKLSTTNLAELVCSASLQVAQVQWAEGHILEALEYIRRASALLSERADGGGEIRTELRTLEQQLLAIARHQ